MLLQADGSKLDVLVRKPAHRAPDEFAKEIGTRLLIGAHRNVLGYVGACWKPVHERLQLFEFASLGNLRDFVRQFRASPDALPMAEQLQFAHDIASGMAHLSSLGIVHGNLAAFGFDHWMYLF